MKVLQNRAWHEPVAARTGNILDRFWLLQGIKVGRTQWETQKETLEVLAQHL